MTTRIVEIPEAINLIAQVVAEKGEDYRYSLDGMDPGDSACKYVVHGKCSCLVGQVLFKLGVSIETLKRLDFDYPEWGEDGARFVRDEHEIDTFPASDVLRFAQDLQDQGDTYGSVLAQTATYARSVNA